MTPHQCSSPGLGALSSGPHSPQTAAGQPCPPLPNATHAAPSPTRPQDAGRRGADRSGGLLGVEPTAPNLTVCWRNPLLWPSRSRPGSGRPCTVARGLMDAAHSRPVPDTHGIGIHRVRDRDRSQSASVVELAAKSQVIIGRRERAARYGPVVIGCDPPLGGSLGVPPKQRRSNPRRYWLRRLPASLHLGKGRRPA